MKPYLFALIAVCVMGCKHSREHQTELSMNASPDTTPKHVVGLDPGWDLAPKASYVASQTLGEIILKAAGENPTAGYDMKLVQSPLRIWPPQWMLARKKPDGIVAQVVSPFEVTASFKAAEPISVVVVTDADGRQEVRVDQAKD